jgi:hypothetical protein
MVIDGELDTPSGFAVLPDGDLGLLAPTEKEAISNG